MIGEVIQGMEETLHETSTDGGNANQEGCDDCNSTCLVLEMAVAWVARKVLSMVVALVVWKGVRMDA